jgi:hypothetical protein
LLAVEASIDTFPDDKEIMTLLVLAGKVRCHKRAVESSLSLRNSAEREGNTEDGPAASRLAH